MNAMIPTEIFLLFAMLPITCLTEQGTLLDGCTRLNFNSFGSTGNETTLSTLLGGYCNASYINRKVTGQWIGMAGAGITKCRICCIHKNENGTLIFESTKAPSTMRCGENKKCNRSGRCVRQSKNNKSR
uniref:Putative secreted protein n=2 Tax=Ixodes ricinus TaxID=34613 RepID=V5HE36_IXORI